LSDITEQKETDKELAMWDNFVLPANVVDKVLELHRSPEIESGDCLAWSGVELVLRPEIYLLTGIPSMGKSTWLDNVIVNSVQQHGYKWGVFSPESHPIESHMKQLIEIATKTNFYGRWHGDTTSERDIRTFCDKFGDNLFMMNPKGDNLKIENILELAEFLVENCGLNALVLDPYNEFSLTRPSHMSETEYVSLFLGDCRRFVNKHNVMIWIVAHPTKLRKEDVTYADGSAGVDYPVPTAYDVAGSANFFNKPDNIVVIHRDKDKVRNPENLVSVVVQKVRKKTTGQLGHYPLYFEYKYSTYDQGNLYTK
jgi:twinkle protein